ncbi:MAG: hypothetical protein V1872_02590 [bacterium]
MQKNRLILKAEIIEELKNVEEIYNDIYKTKTLFDTREPSTVELAGLSSFLQSFYNGIERIFKKIAKEIDDNIPEGMTHHADLLNQMTLDIKGIRSPIISREVYKKLKLLLNFRHRFRHAYHWDLRWIKLKELFSETDSVMKGFKKDIDSFMDFIDELLRQEG